MSLVAELKRRSVFKVGAAYLVVGWVVIQVATSVLPQFDTPGWFLRAFILIVALGFPLALVLAWVFDLTPEGIKVEAAAVGNKRMFAIAAALALLVLGWWMRGGSFGLASTPDGVDVIGSRSIAVLPFVNMSGDAANEYFSDGISEEILNVLARTPELSVAARTSSFQFKGEKRDVEQIAAQLKVRMVLEGSVRKQGERVRITAQLIDAQTGFHLWSQTYDRDLKDIFAIQDEIATAIGNELKVRVGGGMAPVGSSVSGTKNIEAHDLYLRGLSLWQERREDALWSAREVFEKASAADPDYAQAWAGSALVYAILADYSARIGYAESYERGRQAAEHALILDPMLPEAYAALGGIEGNSGHMEIAIALLRRAIELRPSYATAHQWLGNNLVLVGDPEGGLVELRRAAALDPRSLIVANNTAAALNVLGRYDEAIATCTPPLGYAPQSTLCPELIGLAHLMAGRVAEARPFFDKWAENWDPGTAPQVAALFAALEGRADRAAFARSLVATPHRSWYMKGSGYLFTNYEIPVLLMLLEQPGSTLDYIERNAKLDEYGSFSSTLPIPLFDPIRCDPRFIAAAKAQRMVDLRAAKVCGAMPKTASQAGA